MDFIALSYTFPNYAYSWKIGVTKAKVIKTATTDTALLALGALFWP